MLWLFLATTQETQGEVAERQQHSHTSSSTENNHNLAKLYSSIPVLELSVRVVRNGYCSARQAGFLKEVHNFVKDIAQYRNISYFRIQYG